MREARWTPGPWSALETPEGREFEVHDPEGAYICGVSFCPEGDGPSYSVARAEARLIAAAPDLYAALDLFVSEYVDFVESGDAGFWDAEAEDKVKLARAALARARGEQS